MTRRRKAIWLATATTVVSGLAPIARTEATGGSDSNPGYTAGLMTVCSTDKFVRIGGVNDSPVSVTVEMAEKSGQGKTGDQLTGYSSDELRAIYPVTIPAASKNVVTWDLPIPAHIKGAVRNGGDATKHGGWTKEHWQDQNGLDYKGTGGAAEPNGVACPSEPPPVQVNPVSLYSTANSQLAPLAGDGSATTEFVTQMLSSSPPTWAWLNADLGENVPLVRIEWMWFAPGSADQFRIDASVDGIKWTTVATPGESPVGDWNSVQVNQKVRIVRFSFHNPKHDPQLGHLAEVRFFAAGGFVASDRPTVLNAAEITSRAEVAVTPPSGAILKGSRYRVKRSTRSSNSPEGSSHLTIDAKSDTAWQTAMAVTPRNGWTAYDLGDTVALGEIRWKFSKVGFADKFVVQSSPDGVHWTTFATGGNARSADAWVKLTTTVQTRWVRFLFSNPNKDANIGYLSEVRFYPAT